jgi:uncharacterized membrane protein YciS (DUF1049 family)
MQRSYIILIFLLLIALTFAIQNKDAITVRFLLWSYEASQAFIFAVLLFVGFLCGWLFILNKVGKRNRQIKTLSKRVKELEAKIPAVPESKPAKN